jgi:hypothetical protein
MARISLGSMTARNYPGFFVAAGFAGCFSAVAFSGTSRLGATRLAIA